MKYLLALQLEDVLAIISTVLKCGNRKNSLDFGEDRNSKPVLGNTPLHLCIKIVSPLYYCKIAMELLWQIRMQAL